MAQLEDLTPGASLRGILPDGLVTVVSVQWHGSEAIELTYKTSAGKVANELLFRADESRLELAEKGRPWSLDGEPCSGRAPSLSASAWRTCSTCPGGPHLQPRTALAPDMAIYEHMLPGQPLRSVVADDPARTVHD